jgi:hypothetical protein
MAHSCIRVHIDSASSFWHLRVERYALHARNFNLIRGLAHDGSCVESGQPHLNNGTGLVREEIWRNHQIETSVLSQ